MSRGVKAPFKSYEGRKYKDKHIRLTNDMMQHDMFKSLQYTSQVLYLYMKLWACGEIEFEYSWRLASNVLKSSRTYQSAKKELIAKGFIIITRTCKCSDQPNRYEFVSEWSK